MSTHKSLLYKNAGIQKQKKMFNKIIDDEPICMCIMSFITKDKDIASF
jgi:hypothetical protein